MFVPVKTELCNRVKEPEQWKMFLGPDLLLAQADKLRPRERKWLE